jgi:hypothetical protein
MFPGNPSHLDSQDGEYVEVGGLMSYSADDTESFRRAAVYEACRLAGSNSRRAGDQSENSETDRTDDSAERAGAGGQGHPIGARRKA